jgi:hypothetical protein
MSTESTIEEKKEYSSVLRTWLPRAIEALIGAVLHVAGFIKAADLLGFIQQI